MEQLLISGYRGNKSERRCVSLYDAAAEKTYSLLCGGLAMRRANAASGTLAGDHVLVNKLAYAPPGAWSRHLFPNREIRRRDNIVFRYS
jgi:hypothetical protein